MDDKHGINSNNKNLNWKIESVKIIIMEFLRKKGYVKFEKQSLNVLSDLFIEMIKSILIKTKSISNYRKKDSSSLLDLIGALKLMNIKLSDIEEIINDKKEEQSINNFSKISNNIIREYTEEEQFSTKIFDNELDLTQNYKYKPILCKYENGFISPFKDRENLLFISLPPLISTQKSKDFDELEFKETDVKNFKVEEKRTYELENCKINPKNTIINESDISDNDEIKIKIPKLNNSNRNIFSNPNKIVENIDITNITNDQLFN